MSGGGGSSQPSTTTTISKSEPPAYVQPYSEQLMTRAGELSNAPYQQYTGQRIAGLTPEHQTALQGITQRASQGSPLMNATQDMMTQTASGSYLNPESNPYLQGQVQAAQRDVMTGLGAQNRAAFGNTGMDYITGKALADATNNVYAQNYNNERTNQMRAAMFAPQLAAADYTDYQNLLGVGDIYRDNTQEQLNQQYQDWTQQQQWPYQQLDVLANAIRTSMGGGGSSVTSAPNAYQSNSTASMIGGGLAGYGIGQAAGINPYLSAGGGALLGGLL